MVSPATGLTAPVESVMTSRVVLVLEEIPMRRSGPS